MNFWDTNCPVCNKVVCRSSLVSLRDVYQFRGITEICRDCETTLNKAHDKFFNEAMDQMRNSFRDYLIRYYVEHKVFERAAQKRKARWIKIKNFLMFWRKRGNLTKEGAIE